MPARTKIEVDARALCIAFRDDEGIHNIKLMYVNRRAIAQVRNEKGDGFFTVIFLTGESAPLVVKFSVKADPPAGVAKIVKITEKPGSTFKDNDFPAADFNTNAKAAKLFASWML